MTDSLRLKWGTLKAYRIESESAKAAMQSYFDAGELYMSAALQRDNDQQKLALCAVIDAIDGDVYNDWSGENMTKEEAKKYVMKYET